MTTCSPSERFSKYLQSQIMHPLKFKYTRFNNFHLNFKVTRFYLDLQGNQDFRAPAAKILPHRDRISITKNPQDLVCNSQYHPLKIYYHATSNTCISTFSHSFTCITCHILRRISQIRELFDMFSFFFVFQIFFRMFLNF